MTIQVRYDPRKEVIIHEIIPYDSPEEMVKNLTMGLQGPFPPLQWVAGLLLSFNPMPLTQEVSKEILQGKVHWDTCIVSPMKKYREFVSLPPGMVQINVQDVSNNETFRSVGKELRDKILPEIKKNLI